MLNSEDGGWKNIVHNNFGEIRSVARGRKKIRMDNLGDTVPYAKKKPQYAMYTAHRSPIFWATDLLLQMT